MLNKTGVAVQSGKHLPSSLCFPNTLEGKVVAESGVLLSLSRDSWNQLPPLCFTTSESCTGQDLADLGDRLRDWFQLLHGNSKQNQSGRPGAGTASGQ